eukprot:TRINITY_DN10542_c0_g4_i1.p1 TRINITY_DN10542_c0_g4~~TRINITY_DN10542_c0_g4_i1.p1  ORF type:complete len:543 (-),score=104.57 TRINITY_DN10542_c0_g4_i1:333-1961(-)
MIRADNGGVKAGGESFQLKVGKKEPSMRLESKSDLREEAVDELNCESSEESYNDESQLKLNQEEDKGESQDDDMDESMEDDMDEREEGVRDRREESKEEKAVQEFSIRPPDNLPTLHPSKRIRMHRLFLRYAELVEEAGQFFMKSRQYTRLLTDSGIFDITSRFNKANANLTYTALAKKQKFGINFTLFLNCFFKIAETLYPELAKEKRSNAFNHLIKEKVLPFQERVCDSRSANYQSIGGMSIVASNLVYDSAVKELMSYSITTLRSIYDTNFIELMKTEENDAIELAAKKLIAFLKDFDLLPQFIQKQSAIMLLDELLNMAGDQLTNCGEYVFDDPAQDCGAYFTFSRFLVLLFWISAIGFDSKKSNPEEYSSSEKLYCLLMKMEGSKGFAAMCKHLNKNLTIVKAEQVPPRLIVSSADKCIRRAKQGKKLKLHIESEAVSLMEAMSEEEKMVMKDCKERLKQIFMWYCSLTESGNENKMTLTKLLLFTKDAGVLVDSLEIPESKSTVSDELSCGRKSADHHRSRTHIHQGSWSGGSGGS